MKRCFIFKDGTSQKFWNIDIEDCEFTVNYGKLGTDGQTQVKSFNDEATCLKEAEKLISQKTKKGYIESDEDSVKNEKNEAKRYSLSYDDVDEKGRDSEWLIDKILNDKRLPELKYITIGAWEEPYDQDCQPFIDMFINNKNKFQHLESIFIGDMDYEDCECSWIMQGDYSGLFGALPNLKELKIKGSQALNIGVIEHNNLRHFEIISGGLLVEIINNLKKSKLPNLETLILYIGVDDYGWDGAIGDFNGLLTKSLFPNLKHLGIVNADIQDEITELILNCDLLPQLEVLQLSYGCLTDKGGQMLLDAENKLKHLKKLDLEYNWLSDDMAKKLKKLPIDVDVSDSQYDENEDDDDYRYPMITE